MDKHLGFGDLRRDVEVGLGGRFRSILYHDGAVLLVCLRLLLLPLFQGLQIFGFGLSCFRLDQFFVQVGQMAHVVDAPLTVGRGSHLDGENVGEHPFAVIFAGHFGEAGACHRACSEERHVALAVLRIEGDRLAEQIGKPSVHLVGNERGPLAQDFAACLDFFRL